MSLRYLEDQQLLEAISKVFLDSEGRYGSPRVYEELKSQGIKVGKNN